LIWTERVEKVNDKTISITIISVFLCSIVVGGILSAMYNEPIWILGSLGFATIFGVIIHQVDKYFNKGK
jgi:membrane protein YdbS with pleckstrin-like domain